MFILWGLKIIKLKYCKILYELACLLFRNEYENFCILGEEGKNIN